MFLLSTSLLVQTNVPWEGIMTVLARQVRFGLPWPGREGLKSSPLSLLDRPLSDRGLSISDRPLSPAPCNGCGRPLSQPPTDLRQTPVTDTCLQRTDPYDRPLSSQSLVALPRASLVVFCRSPAVLS